MNKLRRLKIRMISALLFILILVFFTNSIAIIERESNSAKDFFIESAESFSGLSVLYIIDSYELYYESGFYKFAEIIDGLKLLNKNVERIQILDVNGKILFDSREIEFGKYNEESFGERYLDDNSIVKRAGNSTVSTNEIIDNEKFLDIIQPYNEEWGRHDYSVRYFISLSGLEEVKKGIISTTLVYSVIFILISFFLIFFFFNQFISLPIRQMIKDLEKKIKHKNKNSNNEKNIRIKD